MPAPLRVLRLRFRRGEEFDRSYLVAFSSGGIFYPSREALPVGTSVVVAIRVGALREWVVLRGSVAWRRAGRHREKLRAGLGIEFHPGDTAKRDFLLSISRGRVLAAVPRRHQRLPVQPSIEVAWRNSFETVHHRSRLLDIGPGGARLSADSPPIAGTDVVIDLLLPGAQSSLPVAARVAWVKPPEANATEVGMAFRWRDAGGARRLRELCRRLTENSV